MARFIPDGSYQKTSQDISVTLYCEAQRLDQSWIASGYPISQLSEPNAGLVNRDGYLAPEEGSYPAKGFIPEGSYQKTCRNIRVTLGAQCQKSDKSWHYSALDITGYSSAQGDIANLDGVLKINPR